MDFGDPKRLWAGKHWDYTDIYIDYPFEQVMFRWDSYNKKIFRKFYGERQELEVSHDNKLWNDATCDGTEITKEYYELEVSHGNKLWNNVACDGTEITKDSDYTPEKSISYSGEAKTTLKG